MNILPDESVPVQITKALPGHNIATVHGLGWKGLENGTLLRRAEADGFDLFILADKNLRYQQNLAGRKIALLELWTNHRPTLEKHFEILRLAVTETKPGTYQILSAPTS